MGQPSQRMVHRATTVDGIADGATVPPRRWTALLRLVASVVLIALCAIGFCCLAAAIGVVALYVHVGREGLIDYYQELRFDYALKTLVGAAIIGWLYIGIVAATLGAARWRAGGAWRLLVALGPVGGRSRTIVALFAATLGYAALATLVMTLKREHRPISAGPTDVVLLGQIAANLVLLAPLAEELLFRGWLYTGLRRQWRFWPSFVVTALAFASIHWDGTHRRILLVLPLAVALGVLRELTGSIRPTLALHALYNLIIVSITLLEA